jgi:hypothetical protein
MDEQGAQELPEMRNAFSGTTADVREHCIEETIRQAHENNSNHGSGSPSSSVDMKRASSVRQHPSTYLIYTILFLIYRIYHLTPIFIFSKLIKKLNRLHSSVAMTAVVKTCLKS